MKKAKKNPITLITQIVSITICLLILIAAAVSLYKSIKIKVDLNKEYASIEETINHLNEEIKLLESEKEKLSDPNYVNAIARTKYNLTKVGEEVYTLQTLDD